MALTVEDGTGLVGADAYISVANADTYFLASANATWAAATIPAKEVAIVKATRYMEKRFGTKWKGLIASSEQALGWPRRYVYDERGTELVDQVPVQIARACAEYAVQALVNPLIPETVYPIADGAPVPFGRINRRWRRLARSTKRPTIRPARLMSPVLDQVRLWSTGTKLSNTLKPTSSSGRSSRAPRG